jgi:hypothetical protein
VITVRRRERVFDQSVIASPGFGVGGSCANGLLIPNLPAVLRGRIVKSKSMHQVGCSDETDVVFVPTG